MGMPARGKLIRVGGKLSVPGTGEEIFLINFLLQTQTTSGEQVADAHPTATVEPEMAEPQSTASALMELRRYTGLTWDQLAKLFGVDRRSLHFWASGRPLSPANEERLRRTLATIHTVDRGSAGENRALLFQERKGEIPFDLLAAGRYEEVVTLVGEGSGRRTLKLSPLSPEAQAARAPRPPEELVGALHDPVHREVGKARAARTVKARRK